MELLTRYSHRKEPFYFSFQGRAIWMLRDSPSYADAEYRKEKEHIIAELCVDLIDRCGWYLSNIHIGELVPVVSQAGWSYPEADILLTDGVGRPCTLIKVVPRGRYAEEMAAGVEELFTLAHALRMEKSAYPLSLVYCTQWHEHGSTTQQVMVIDYGRFTSFAAWDAVGRPFGDALPHRKLDADGRK